MRPLRILALAAVLVATAGCGSNAASKAPAGNSTSAPITSGPAASPPTTDVPTTASNGSAPLSRTDLIACIKQHGEQVHNQQETGFAPPGGAFRIGPDGTGIIAGVYPNTSYAHAQAQVVIALAAAYVGKPTAQANVHQQGTLVWFPQHSPFTGQHSKALDACTSGI